MYRVIILNSPVGLFRHSVSPPSHGTTSSPLQGSTVWISTYQIRAMSATPTHRYPIRTRSLHRGSSHESAPRNQRGSRLSEAKLDGSALEWVRTNQPFPSAHP